LICGKNIKYPLRRVIWNDTRVNRYHHQYQYYHIYIINLINSMFKVIYLYMNTPAWPHAKNMKLENQLFTVARVNNFRNSFAGNCI
jgi:hypothetical protein